MTPKTPERPSDLSVEDFRRLGVRPNEVRLSVIRTAATRNARPLASGLLETQDDASWLQLARVATSTYRLLDPRLRQNVHHRAYVGRILPNALDAASLTRFYSTEHGDAADQSVSALFHPAHVAMEPPVANALSYDTDSWERLIDQEISFDNPRKSNRPKRRRLRSRRRLQFLGAFAAVGSIIGTGLAWYSISKKIQFRDSQRIASQTVVAEPMLLSQPEPLRDDLKRDDLNLGQVPTPGVQPQVVAEAEDAVPLTLPAIEKTLPVDPSSFSDAELQPAGEEAELARLGLESESEQPLTLPDPEWENPVLPTLASEEPSSPASLVQPSVAVSQPPFQPPYPEDVAIARRRVLRRALSESLGGASVSITQSNLPRLRTAMENAFHQSMSGSVDHYAAATLLCDLRWLDCRDASQAIDEVAVRFTDYQIDPSKVWADSYQQALIQVTYPADFESLHHAGLGLTDRLIRDGQFDAATTIIDAVQQRSSELGITDVAGEDLSRTLNGYEKSIRYAQRISTTAHRVLRLHGDVDSIPTDVSGGGSLGRYFCLIQGQWHSGLRFLAMTSDPKLASAAKAELNQHQSDPFLNDPLDWLTLADRWDAVAGHLSGRSADQVRLHAIELLELAVRRSVDTDADREVILAKIQQLQFQLPVHQQPADSSETDPSIADDQESADQESDDLKLEDHGLRGRILADGQDLGVRFRCQTDVAITPAMLQAIEKQLRRSLANTTILLNGVIHCDQAQQIVFTLAPDSNAWPQELLIDGDVVEINRLNESAEVSVGAGRHTIAWIINLGETFLPLSLSLRDAQTFKRIPIAPLSDEDAAAVSGDLTISVTRIGE